MKKVISYLITIMMVLTMMPYVAFADNVSDQGNAENENIALYVEQSNELYTGGDAEPTVEVIDVVPFSDTDEGIAPNGSGETEYAETVEEAAAGLRSAMVERQTNVVVNIKVDELTEEALTTKCSEIFTEAIKHTGNPKEGDSLKWVWENWNCSISGTSDGSNCYATITYDITYYTTAEQEAALTSAVESLKEELNLEGKTDYEKVKAIYDYMVANISYDYTNLENDSHKLKYTAYAALVNKTSVCQGYATLFYRLALEYGIDARVIAGDSLNNNGESERHSWNIVKLNDKYYNLDTTWDSTWDSDKTTHDFLLQGTNTFDNHTRDAEFTTDEFNTAYPMSEADYVISTNETEVTEGDFTAVISNGEAAITAYTGSDANVVIPGTVGGVPVTVIGYTSFTENKAIKSVEFPVSVKMISGCNRETEGYFYRFVGAFSDCDNLTTVIFPTDSELTYIGEFAFARCPKLKNIVLPNHINELALSCFDSCTALGELELPEGLTTIGQNVFAFTSIEQITLPSTCNFFNPTQNLPSLRAINVADGNAVYRSHEGVLYENMKEFGWTLTIYPESKFENEYTVPDFAQTVYCDAFLAVDTYVAGKEPNLKKINIGDCKGFGFLIDYELSRIRAEIIVSETNPYYQMIDGMIVSKDGTVLEQVPSNKSGVLNIPEGVTEIAGCACEFGSISEVNMPDTVVIVGADAFRDCYKLESVTISKCLEEISVGMFSNCFELNNIILPNGLKKIAFNAFMSCYNLHEIELPSGVKVIDGQAFAECRGLKSITIPDSVTTMGEGVFIRCTNLETVKIPDNITDIGFQSFCECEALKNIVLPEAATSIPGNCFARCESLSSIYIPASVLKIGDTAFTSCDNLKDIYYSGTESDWDKIIVGIENEILSKAVVHFNAKPEDVYIHIHEMKKICAMAATCTEDGNIEHYKCSKCNKLYSDADGKTEITEAETIDPATGHTYGKWEETTEPTCTEPGEESRECACGEKETKTVDKLDHNYEESVTAPTCEEYGYTTYTCSVCNDSYVEDGDEPLGHDYEAVETKPTCTEKGYIKYTCKRNASHTYTTELDPDGHEMKEHAAVDATCEEAGNIAYYTCNVCEGYFLDEKGEEAIAADKVVVAATGHKYGAYKTTTKAKFGKDGEQTSTCAACSDKVTKPITAPKTIKLSYAEYTYNGKIKKPTVKAVYDSNGNKISSANYKVSYASGRKNVGKYKVTVTFNKNSADYTGSSYTTFKINPKGTTISSLAKVKKGFTVKWKKQTGKMAKTRITGYQYRYSTSSKMTNAVTKTVKGYGKTSAKKTGLKAKKTYYVQVRTYKTVSGVKYYSPWSKYKKVKTK